MKNKTYIIAIAAIGGAFYLYKRKSNLVLPQTVQEELAQNANTTQLTSLVTAVTPVVSSPILNSNVFDTVLAEANTVRPTLETHGTPYIAPTVTPIKPTLFTQSEPLVATTYPAITPNFTIPKYSLTDQRL